MLTIGYVIFFVIHILQVGIAGWNNFRSVISGFDVISTETSEEQNKTTKNETADEENK